MASLDGGKIEFDCRYTDTMKEPKENIPHELLAKFFAREATQEEQRVVMGWKSDNPELFNQYFVLWQDTGYLTASIDLPSFDADKAWSTFQKNTFKSEDSRSLWPNLWKIAAVILFFLATALWFFPRQPAAVLLTTVTVENQSANVQLSDGSSITLNQNSALKYVGDFGEKSRTVELNGEAFFEVAHDEQRPFTVQAGATKVVVLGTSFNVKAETSGIVTVTVLTGKVAFQSTDQSIELVEGQSAIFNQETKELKQKEADLTGIDTFWKNKKLTFDGQVLSEVLKTIEWAYQVDIELESPALTQCQLRVVFDHSPIEEVMEVIALTLDLEVRKADNRYFLSGKGCAENQ